MKSLEIKEVFFNKYFHDIKNIEDYIVISPLKFNEMDFTKLEWLKFDPYIEEIMIVDMVNLKRDVCLDYKEYK